MNVAMSFGGPQEPHKRSSGVHSHAPHAPHTPHVPHSHKKSAQHDSKKESRSSPPSASIMQMASCKECTDDISEMELHAEIEHLKRHLAERDAHIEAMESEFLKGNTRIAELEEQIVGWKEKYDRLYDSHRRVQRVNQNLEEKLLQMVDKCADDKSQLTRDVETLSVRLAESNCTIGHLHKENERYKNDMNLAIQLLQCKPDNFVSQKFDSLPPETQARVSSYIMSKAKLNQDSNFQIGKNTSQTVEKINPDDFEFNISASLMSKILEESVQNSISNHCDTCTCLKKSINPFGYSKSQHSVATQTVLKHENLNTICFHCNSDITSLHSSVSGKCNSPISGKLPNEEKDMLQLSDTEKSNSIPSFVPTSQNKKFSVDEYNKSGKLITNMKTIKNDEEHVKLVNQKHIEIMTKIGEDIKQLSMKDRYAIPPLEPITGHHRLCDRTKSINNDISKFEDCTKISKSVSQSSGISKTAVPTNVADITFGEIENSVLIPNIVDSKNDSFPTKADLNSVNNKKIFCGSSISSNDAESKTSSNKSYQNSSHNGSNSKVHIGPGPRFCSLIMQAGSKNILLDNAQPNIAPVLYTRQSKHLDSTSITSLNNNSLTVNSKRNVTPISANDHLSDFIANEKKMSSSDLNRITLSSVDNLLDLPNEEIMKNPTDIIEKPESGYKSNESAEIIDKLLFGVDNMVPNDPNKNVIQIDDILPLSEYKNEIPIGNSQDATVNENFCENESEKMMKNDVNDLYINQKSVADHVKMFNFDNYEKSLKRTTNVKTPKDVILLDTPVNNELDCNKITDESHFLNEGTELLSSNFDLKIASKNLSEINKKFQISQVLPENSIENQKNKEWKKEASTEKSSSSLSSDDSAAVLQKQQLIRVAEWVQKNLEMEQQIDFDNSDSCHQSAEEMHHVRNDFPRPAKIDHRMRKNNLKTSHSHSHKMSYHPSKHSFNSKISENIGVTAPQFCSNQGFESGRDNRLNHSQDYDELDPNIENLDVSTIMEKVDVDAPKRHKKQNLSDIKIAIDESNTDVTSSTSTSKTYTKEELARMEYNVKQFLLNGTRWTRVAQENHSRARRTSSKTETDL